MVMNIFDVFVVGPTLKEHISMNKALSSFEALMYLQHLLELLVYLKCKNVIHNDIKGKLHLPSSFLLFYVFFLDRKNK